jgi:hypothetical protein
VQEHLARYICININEIAEVFVLTEYDDSVGEDGVVTEFEHETRRWLREIAAEWSLTK